MTGQEEDKQTLAFVFADVFREVRPDIRLFFQIWNTLDGTIAWEGTEEVTHTWDSSSEKPVTFRIIVEETARNLINSLP